jgi:hypothetical protein
MNQFNFVPKTPSQNAQQLLLSAPAMAPTGQNQAISFSSGPSMAMRPKQQKPLVKNENDQKLEGRNSELNVTHSLILNQEYQAEHYQSFKPNPTLGLEQKAILTMGLSLLWDASKDFTLDMSDFLQIMNQSSAQRSANRAAYIVKDAEPEALPLNDPIKNNLNKHNELDYLLPALDAKVDHEMGTWVTPESPAKKAGISIEQAPRPQAQTRNIAAPAPSISAGPGM